MEQAQWLVQTPTSAVDLSEVIAVVREARERSPSSKELEQVLGELLGATHLPGEAQVRAQTNP